MYGHPNLTASHFLRAGLRHLAETTDPRTRAVLLSVLLRQNQLARGAA